MKLKLTALAVVLLCGTALFAQELPDAPTPKQGNAPVEPSTKIAAQENRTGSYLFFYASAACGVGLALSGDRARSAEIGVPVYLAANLLAHKLHANHPKVSYFLQIVSPAGCYAGYNKDRKAVVTGGGDGNGGNGGNGGSGGGSGGTGDGGGGNTGGGSTGGNGGGSGGGSTGGGGTGGNGGGSGGGNPPPGGGCTVHGGTDCGFGNGGLDNGKNGKPPVTPPGDPHTHGNK